MEGDFGAEEVGGPVGEDAEVVFLEDLGGEGRGGGVSFVCLFVCLTGEEWGVVVCGRGGEGCGFAYGFCHCGGGGIMEEVI